MNKIYKKIVLLLMIFIFTLSVTCCRSQSNLQNNQEKLKIISVSFPAYDFAKKIAGDKADVSMLISPGQESHTFEPTPRDIINIRQADLLIIGGKSDTWVQKLIDSSELDESKILSMMDCVTLISEEESEETHHEHDHSSFYDYDEHVWTSPVNAMEICKKITEKLIAKSPDNTQLFFDNLNNYLQELNALDETFSNIVTEGKRKTLIFGDRFPFRYFADRYGLSYYAAFPGCSAETEPDAAMIKFLIDKVNDNHIPVVLHIELSNTDIADAICEATGAKKALFHSCHGVTNDELSQGETYISIMMKNADVLKEALS